MATSSHPGGHEARRDRFVEESRHDSYKLPSKLAEPTVCPTCSAVFHKGRWSWVAPPAEAQETVCPACHRLKDKRPKGVLMLKGTLDRKSTRLNSSHMSESRMPSSA